VRELAACGADVNAGNWNNRSPVFMAAMHGPAACVRALAACGADVSAVDTDACTPLHGAAIHDHAAVVWALVQECGVNPASLNRDGKTARDLAPPGSSAYKALEWLEELPEPKQSSYAEENTKKRADGFECPVCLEDTKGEAIAFVPCGHRMCPGCWAEMRVKHKDKCPQCRAPIAHGMPQDSWPDRHPLYARFCVEAADVRRRVL
jgi:hypothetical protein